MLAETAEWLLAGRIPHVDYQEPYTGGLTWLYAVIFKVGGVDLINVRWFLFPFAAVALIVTYLIIRRFLPPVASAVATWLALAWSFPNYFAGLPSWWLLICALGCVWALIRHVETGLLRYVALAGLLIGCAIVIKQTGVYLLIAVALSLLASATGSGQPTRLTRNLDRLLRFGAGAFAVALAIAIMRKRLGPSEFGYLLIPVACSSLALSSHRLSTSGSILRARLAPVLLVCVMAALPLALLSAPYFIHGHLPDLVNGAILLPQRRIAFASYPLPPVGHLLTGVAMMTLMVPMPSRLTGRDRRILTTLRWALASGLTAVAFSSTVAYQFLFGSVRAVASLLPVLIAGLLLSSRVTDVKQRRILLIAASMLAWMSLVQFPFAAPIYFCYVTPLAVIAAVAAGSATASIRRPGVLTWTTLLLVFAVFNLNGRDVRAFGVERLERSDFVALNLPRAHLDVQEGEAATYRSVVSLIEARLHGGTLLAGPDCPEVYFLARRSSPSGTVFDFFLGDEPPYVHDVGYWAQAQVIVINRLPDFSPRVADGLLAELRDVFPHGQQVERFEVRWR
jgi:hypothetical protein